MEELEVIIRRIKAGEVHFYEKIVEEYQQKLFKYCFHMLSNVQEAEDIVQEVLFKAYEKLNKYKENTSFSAWLYRIAYNQCLNLIKRKKIIQFIPFIEDGKSIEESTSRFIENNELTEELSKGLERLKPEDRSILILRIVEEKSFDEICSILGITEGNARKKYERARKKLKQYLVNEKGGLKDDGFAVNG